MFENTNAPLGSRDEGAESPENYLARATAACEAGDARLGLHLYLAAFEQAAEASEVPSEDAIMGLKQAWRVACSTKERALAEYIFERLEPFLTNDEAEACATQLQGLAFDRLAEFGFSRDDAGKFLASYYKSKIYESDPFAKLDQNGVGQLVKMAAEKGRSTRPDLKLGICGEHGGDPSSVEFCHKVGLNYVSCSPFRVPIARLAAAQAAINNVGK